VPLAPPTPEPPRCADRVGAREGPLGSLRGLADVRGHPADGDTGAGGGAWLGTESCVVVEFFLVRAGVFVLI